ncbi:MAG: cyclic nucleotide-binding domain-containing protein [Saprospiraceae bacterium]
MNQKLLDFLSTFPDLSKEEVEAIAAHIPIVEIKKGTVFLKEGEVPGKCYFVLEGCVRQYTLVDGEEKTTAFYTEKFGTISQQITPTGLLQGITWFVLKILCCFGETRVKAWKILQNFRF